MMFTNFKLFELLKYTLAQLILFLPFLAANNHHTILSTIKYPEDTVLDEANSSQKKQIRARDLNAKGVHSLIQALETPELMNKIMLEQIRDVKWPGGKFSNMWDAIVEDEQPDDVVAEMSMEDDLRKLRFIVSKLKPHLPKWKLPVSGPKAVLITRLGDYQRLHHMNIGVVINQPIAVPKQIIKYQQATRKRGNLESQKYSYKDAHGQNLSSTQHVIR